ncbi:hypothetical protein CONLIGDRAFT_324731 [Coniochaeta ligniaria NRRL 30616]|uniref:JmjC domain-containing protein n=1 Tax=Coniochaeta ligniaria NRRL 30616 TaxID=1408157 RepID=A0A1J7J7Z0_9PEZI|nr:hypothetical protein CONLIGDRAFT_324731 [Coniochaeta ligniaria NRRL 30616]
MGYRYLSSGLAYHTPGHTPRGHGCWRALQCVSLCILGEVNRKCPAYGGFGCLRKRDGCRLGQRDMVRGAQMLALGIPEAQAQIRGANDSYVRHPSEGSLAVHPPQWGPLTSPFLTKHGVAFRQVVQLPGQIIVRLPGAYHQVVNQGPNVAVAVTLLPTGQ